MADVDFAEKDRQRTASDLRSQRRIYTCIMLSTVGAAAWSNSIFMIVMLGVNAMIWLLTLLTMTSDIRYLDRR